MAKKVKFESFRYQFLVAARDAGRSLPKSTRQAWDEFVDGIRFNYVNGIVTVMWCGKVSGEAKFSVGDFVWIGRAEVSGYAEDPLRLRNAAYFAHCVFGVACQAGFGDIGDGSAQSWAERDFHDAWASQEDVEGIDVQQMNEACTAPEMRYIVERLGDLRGKRLLDVGCGLGEASVYFAIRGAKVTATDLSPGMLDAASRLATANGVRIRTHLSAAESLQLPVDEVFDVIYAGNLLHHVDIPATLERLSCRLAPQGVFVSWDPLAYNPVINVYRRMATGVRTADEHPLTRADISGFRHYFPYVEARYFWLTTLVLFVIMAVIQRRDPNRERFWKAVVREERSWRRLYRPLERLDMLLLKFLPPLRLMCWNVVVIASVTTNTAVAGSRE
ncbi:MAG: class I SAM-dependent methyltransferase [Pseudomonadota bacterium]